MRISEEEYLVLLRKRDLADELLKMLKIAVTKLEELKGKGAGIVDVLLASDEVIAKAGVAI